MQNSDDKKIAVLDLGTNTFHLLIASVNENSIRFLFRKTIPVVLGQEGLDDRLIHRDATSRAINALSEFRDHMNYYGVSEHKALATSAIRDANNGKEFIESAFRETGIRIEPIAGEREAELIYRGVKEGVPITEMSLIMDIGGGSTEFIICDQNEIKWKKSFPIGASRLKEKFMHSDPLQETDVQSMLNYISLALSELQQQIDIFQPSKLIGSAGSFETLCSLADSNYVSYENWNGAIPEHVIIAAKGFKIDLNALKKIYAKLIRSTHEERLNIIEIPEVRKDMIIPALIQLHAVIDSVNPKELWLSVYSLKEGILYNWLDELSLS